MERRTRVLVACVLFTVALLIGQSGTVLGAMRPARFDAALLTVLALR